MALEKRFVVQDRETRYFLGMEEDGDLGHVPFINRAFLFEDEEQASLAGFGLCDVGGYLMFGFWREYLDVGKR